MILKWSLSRQNVNDRRGSYIGLLTHLFLQKNHPITASCQRLIITTVNWKTSEAASTMVLSAVNILHGVSCLHQRHQMKVLTCHSKVPNEKHLLTYNVLVLVAGICLHITARITDWKEIIIAVAKHLQLQFIVDAVLSWLKIKPWRVFHGEPWMKLEGKLFLSAKNVAADKIWANFHCTGLPCRKMHKP